MPELPEVETTRRGISSYILHHKVHAFKVREPRLRWPVPTALAKILPGQRIDSIKRRAKYLLLGAETGTLIIHLGMSGSLHIVAAKLAPETHDHVDIIMDNGQCLRLRDPRRFGAVLWTTQDPCQHPLLRHIGPEPLTKSFSGNYLYRASRKRRCAIKTLLMNARIVAGVGNIYANEALYHAGIRPGWAAGRLSHQDCGALAMAVKSTLKQAIRAGGTTLKDFTNSVGQPGYFGQSLQVYGRQDRPCMRCASPIKRKIIAQRASYYCPKCQS